MSDKILDEEWEAVGGHLATKRVFDYKTSYGVELKDRRWISFNIGKELAQHIAQLQNDHLRKEQKRNPDIDDGA
jgi:hypothetical protein